MRAKLFFLLLVLPIFAHAEEPPYFLDPITGHVITDIVTRGTFKFTPGTLKNCKVYSQQQTYTTWTCEADGALFEVFLGGKTISIPLANLYASEYQQGSGLSQLSYNLSGVYNETFSDGTVFEATSQLSMERRSDNLTRVTGRVSLGTLFQGATIVATVKP
ncbi:hypothetical protein K2X33_15655 [bacterium]|nr:hypothetical protein [bacterium]